MQMSKKQVGRLLQIIETAQQILAEASRESGLEPSAKAGGRDAGKRRVGKELLEFKKMIKAERKGGTSVADIARKHGVTPSYIYQL